MAHLPRYFLTLFLQIIGFTIGVIPQVRRLMIGEDAPLRMIEGSASILGYYHSDLLLFGLKSSIRNMLCGKPRSTNIRGYNIVSRYEYIMLARNYTCCFGWTPFTSIWAKVDVNLDFILFYFELLRVHDTFSSILDISLWKSPKYPFIDVHPF